MTNPVRDTFDEAVKLFEQGEDKEAKALLRGLVAPFALAAMKQVADEKKAAEAPGEDG